MFCNGFRRVGEGKTNPLPQWPSRCCVARHLLGSSQGTRLKPERSLPAFLPNQTTREHGSASILQATMLVKWNRLFATLVPIKAACHLDDRRRTALQGWVSLTNYNFVKYKRYRSLTSYLHVGKVQDPGARERTSQQCCEEQKNAHLNRLAVAVV